MTITLILSVPNLVAGEIFVYFRQSKPANSDWYAIVIYDRRIHETPPHPRYQVLVEQLLRSVERIVP
ncbi:MAG: DUF2887 domain-containing protein [Nostoc sp.]|uniref:DUF2887 domain-containing protein n=1 Tax=Nostoc sp. TaxID=1180 RepID=UPI002FFBE69D